jgi:hypothetical protein
VALPTVVTAGELIPAAEKSPVGTEHGFGGRAKVVIAVFFVAGVEVAGRTAAIALVLARLANALAAAITIAGVIIVRRLFFSALFVRAIQAVQAIICRFTWAPGSAAVARSARRLVVAGTHKHPEEPRRCTAANCPPHPTIVPHRCAGLPVVEAVVRAGDVA